MVRNQASQRSSKPRSAGQRVIELAELEKKIQGMPEEYLECRELGHQWGPYTARYMPGYRNIVERTLACRRCKSTKDQQIQANKGHIIWSSNIQYSPGYLISGAGRMDQEARAVVRLASVTNQLMAGFQAGNS